ncbi:RNA-guided pseudouridylation complex pseudouridine synthase subunit Cbf5 [archaeon]|jgi:H/ACA ribonucleoprotein complex subunit 4|nr:RNA-guided pseudouridylation complex pseudouridine synthase subunit Cbf5 [archaeon]MBT6824174.1 RNA-guided pseudouridylation complex pseudouridine synthase subunit Cbf5 [archaeon]MBT7106982.1 RNA-guided pseudouridylation complex pseudouridine synthase subunit Cbf5 [archaeon]MBT7297594.1 RNA-guided pseudouridylation complex pseudouridine synthase subunit Cbf5 [archaeon]
MCLLPFEKTKREIIVKKESISNKDYGKSPKERTTEELIKYGVVNINKPEGPTSHQVTSYVKDILKIEKAGHSGTLDPKVTGVLLIAVEDATRIVQTILTTGKEYICLMKIHKDKPEEEIREAVNSFIGKIKQIPPIRSAVKRRERERTIYYIDILEIKGKEVLLKVGCQAGTYMRKLCHDIGEKLETGAHMDQLVRTKAGPFNDTEWYSLQELIDAYEFYKEGNDSELKKIIKPIEDATSHLPKVWIMDTTVDSISHGAELNIPGISKFHSGIKRKDPVAILTLKGELVALGEAYLSSEEMTEKDMGTAIKTKKVFMKRGIYPKMEFEYDGNNKNN